MRTVPAHFWPAYVGSGSVTKGKGELEVQFSMQAGGSTMTGTDSCKKI
jgi:hypothetical protein